MGWVEVGVGGKDKPKSGSGGKNKVRNDPKSGNRGGVGSMTRSKKKNIFYHETIVMNTRGPCNPPINQLTIFKEKPLLS